MYKAKRVEIALGLSYEDNLEAVELIKLLARVRIVYNGKNNANVLVGSQVTKTIEQHFQPTPIIKEPLSAHPTYDVIQDNTNPCNVFSDTTDEADITTSIHITKESVCDCRKFDAEDTVTMTTSMSHNDDNPWFDAYVDFNLLYNTSETMDDYK